MISMAVFFSATALQELLIIEVISHVDCYEFNPKERIRNDFTI